MPDHDKKSEFTVTDRRRFTSEGEATAEGTREESPEPPKAAAPRPVQQQAPPPAQEAPPAKEEAPQGPMHEGVRDPRSVAPPSTADQQAQHEAFKESSRQLDAQIQSQLGGRRPQDFEMTFERFLASLYMTALMQLGLMDEQGAQHPGVDLIGARQTIDTLGLLSGKTKGNLTPAEDNLLQNCLYEVRMAYVEVTNAIAREAQAPGASPPKSGPNIK